MPKQLGLVSINAERKMRVQAIIKTDSLCPFCKDRIKDAPACVCNSCCTLFHLECFTTAGKCSTFGCVSRISKPQSRQQVDDYYQEILSESQWKFLGQTLLSLFWFIVLLLWSINLLDGFGHSWKDYGLMSFLPIVGFIGMSYNLYLRAKRILIGRQ